MICNLQNLLHFFGLVLCFYSLAVSHSLYTQCFNFTNLAIIWQYFEIVSYVTWISGVFVIGWY